MSGTATTNLPLANNVDDLIGSADGITVRVELARIAALLSYLQGPAYKTSAELFADKNWPASAIGQVYGDAAGQNGTYRKSGDAGSGSWTRTGDLAVSSLSAAQLADKADLVALTALAGEVRAGRVYGHWSGSLSTLTPPEGTDWLLTPAGGSVQLWAAVTEGGAGDEYAQDATGQWWRQRFDSRDLPSLVNEVRTGRVWATGTASPSGQAPPPGTNRIQTLAGTGVQEWVRAAAPNPATETDTLKRDATGQWWQRRFDSRDIPALASELYGIGLTSGIMRLPAVSGTADAIIAEPAAESANVVISNNSLLILTPAQTTTAADPMLTTRGVTRTIRDTDGGLLPAGDLRAGITYILRVRSATEVRIVSGGINQRDIMQLVAALPLIGTASVPVVQGAFKSGQRLTTDAGTGTISNLGWQVSDTRAGTQGWTVISSNAELTLSDSEIGKYIRFRCYINGGTAWVLSNVVGPVTKAEATAAAVTTANDATAKLTGFGAHRRFVPDLPAVVAHMALLRGGVGAAPPMGLYRLSNLSPGTGWLGAVQAALPTTACTLLTTYSPATDVIHPCVIEFANDFCGWRYVCAITAYPGGPSLEDPFLYGSNDRMSWTFLGGAAQPLDQRTAAITGSYNSDTFLTHDPRTGELVVGYRLYLPRDNTSELEANSDVVISCRTTRDGFNWSDKREIMRMPADQQIMLSVTVIFDPETLTWHMWVINRPVMHHWTAPTMYGPWTLDPVTIALPGFNTPHHHEVKWVGDRLVCLLHSKGDAQLFFGVFSAGSWNQIDWNMTGVLNPRPSSLYKASFTPVYDADAGTLAFDIWWTNGAAVAGGMEMGHGRKLQYSRTNAVMIT